MKTISFALIGCGRIANRHAEILGEGLVDKARLVAVCDVNLSKAQALGEKYGVPYFEDYHALMRCMGDEIDVVSILTQSGSHARHCIDLAQYGKPIIVEKPMALTLSDADAMIGACELAGIPLFVVKQNRFNIPVVKLREAVRDGRFGKLVLGTVRVRWCRTQAYYDQDSWRGTWAEDGGVFSNQASHHVDLLQLMMGDVKSVYAKSRTALVNIEADDTGVVIVEFLNGALGVIEVTTATRPSDLEGSISVLGENGAVEIGGFAVNKMCTWQFTQTLPEDADIFSKYSENPPNVYGFGHVRYIEHVVDCLLNKKAPLVDGREGRRSLELITAIYESIESGTEIFMPVVPRKSRLGVA